MKGGAAIVGFTISNSRPIPFDFNLSAYLHPVDPTIDGVVIPGRVIANQPDLSGFSLFAEPYKAQFKFRNSPLVVDADSYWFGYSTNLFDNYFTQVESPILFGPADASFAVSWRDRVVPAFGSVHISFVIRWGEDSRPPVVTLAQLSLSSPIPIDASFTLRGNVSDPDGDTNLSLYGVIDDRISELILLADSVSSDFEFRVEVSSLEITAGSFNLRVYAIDSTGTISEPSSPFAFTVLAPTQSPTKSPSPSETISASSTPAPFVETSGEFALGYNNSVFFTITVDVPGDWSVGLYGLSGELFPSVSELEWSIRLTTVGGTLILGCELRNPLSITKQTRPLISAWSLFSASTNTDFAASSDGTGFSAVHGPVWARFVCKNHPLVTDTETYWFGPGSDARSYALTQIEPGSTFTATDYDGGVALSWPMLTIPPKGRVNFSLVILFGSNSYAPPVLTMSNASLGNVGLDDSVTLEGNIARGGHGQVSLYAVPDGAVARIALVAANREGGEFSVEISVRELNLVSGGHAIVFYPIDGYGTIGNGISRTISLTAPTESPYPSPSPSFTPTSSDRPSRSSQATPFRRTRTNERSPLGSRSPLASGSGAAATTAPCSATASRTPTATPRPQYITVDGDLVLGSSSVVQPVVLSGNGTIRSTGQYLTINDLTIPPGASITAEGLRLSQRFTIQGNSQLAPVPGGYIVCLTELQVVFEVTGGQVPFLDLGAISNSYSKDSVPQSIEIVGLGGADAASVGSRILVSGRTLDKCDEWKALVQLDSTAFALKCRDTTAGRGRVLVDSSREVSLVLVPIVATSAPDSESDSGDVGVIVGVVVGVVVVIGIAGALVFFLVIKKPGGSDSAGETGHGAAP
jgi:hypothetical protein